MLAKARRKYKFKMIKLIHLQPYFLFEDAQKKKNG